MCSLESIAAVQSEDMVRPTVVETTGPPSDDNVTITTSGVGVARCELTAPISNASSTYIQLAFDVVDIEDVDVSGCTTESHTVVPNIQNFPNVRRKSALITILTRNAMLLRYMLSSYVRLSVCPSVRLSG